MTNHFNIMTDIDGVKHYDLTNTIQYLEYKGKQNYGSSFKIHAIDYEVIYQLLSWIVYDKKACTKYALHPDKGILLIGPVGCGKTSLMNLISPLLTKKRAFIIKPARNITIEFSKEGYDVINRYSRSIRSPVALCLDDIGVEPPMRYFGDHINVIGEVLLSRYDLFRSTQILTHGTSNLDADEMENRYGHRVRSRLREMFNMISYDSRSPDKRC